MLEILKNYHQISDRLHTSAQPTSEQFKIIKKSGVEIIVNLALINSPNAIENEAQLVLENTMDYIHIPVDFEKPTTTELKSFFNITGLFLTDIFLGSVPMVSQAENKEYESYLVQYITSDFILLIV